MGCGSSSSGAQRKDAVVPFDGGSQPKTSGSAPKTLTTVVPTAVPTHDLKEDAAELGSKDAHPASVPAGEESQDPSMMTPTASEGLRRADAKRQRVRRQDSSEKVEKELSDVSNKMEVSAENRRFLSKVLRRHFLFGALEEDERNQVVDYMRQQKVASGKVIFSQGDKGDCCYFIMNGVFTVTIDGGNIKQLKSTQSFGELAMLYKVSRTATVTCSSEGILWRMDGHLFRKCMQKLEGKHLQRALAFFDADPVFSKMRDSERRLLAAACSVQVFAKDEQILREGEVGDWMFIVVEGKVQTVDPYGTLSLKKAGAMLGSTGVMYSKQQVSGAKAVDNKVTCLALGKSSVDRMLGSVEDVLRRGAVRSLVLDNTTKTGELSFFKQLTDYQQTAVIDSFQEVSIGAGEKVVAAGSQAQLIIVIEGEVSIAAPAEKSGGTMTPARGSRGSDASGRDFAGSPSGRSILTAGMSYGGKALLENIPIEEELTATTPVRLHRLEHSRLEQALKEPLNAVIRVNEIKKVLSDIFLFKNLNEEQIDRTVRALEKKKFAANEVIVQQGDEANLFYLIQRGSIDVLKDEERVRTLGRWDYFGERGLLLQERRSATCKALEACTCLMLDSSVFTDIVGTFRKELEHRMYLQDLNIQMADLRLRAVVGRGSFGIVKLVYHHSDTRLTYALKCVSKKQVIKQGQQKSIVIERDINAQCYHPCIMQFIKTFQDDSDVYFLTEFLGGGDLFYAIREIGTLSKLQSQFFGASITLALEYLHARSIMYRDLKPENVLLDFAGHAKLVDFGCCKKALRTNTLVGTPEYFSPEVIIGKGYTCSIDWWALGVMMHEFIVGPLPFGRDTKDQLDLFREILEAPLQFPNYVRDEAAISVITGLLERIPELRLGASMRGAKEIKDHRYFNGFDWDALVGCSMKPPWVPDAKKLQKNWELHNGEPVSSSNSQSSTRGDDDPQMEWARVF
mmetsp:Transcript_49647/g.118207  ORF Transcript_49647/g.118207 Transcript_49647/m.118207 type:complete len:963 (-) Transcript_49647:64-2952(-)